MDALEIEETKPFLEQASPRQIQIHDETSRLMEIEQELAQARPFLLQQRQRLGLEMTELRRRGNEQEGGDAHFSVDPSASWYNSLPPRFN